MKKETRRSNSNNKQRNRMKVKKERIKTNMKIEEKKDMFYFNV